MAPHLKTLPILLLLLLIHVPAGHSDCPDLHRPSLTVSGWSESVAVNAVCGSDVDGASIRKHEMRASAQRFEFQAEVHRLMDIIINSLYSHKEIFLRELISNASDALDKIRFMSLTDRKVLGDGDDANLDIHISLDKSSNRLTIRDRGIGMTKDDLVRNLGTIAKSGTSAFLERIQKQGDLNLIGQFGVGFYSVYLVADYVEVITKHNDDKQYIWESDAGGQYAISEDPDGPTLGRGTEINIYLKEETQEYADESLLKDLIRKYSEFINFPIYLYSGEEVPVEQPSKELTEDEEEVADEEEEEEDKGKDDEGKSRTEMQYDWRLVNEQKAIWLRSPGEISDDEYQSFFRAVNKFTVGEAHSWVHFKAEGDVEFTALLFIPKETPLHFYEKYYETGYHSLKLYVRRVFISDEFDNLLPRYLGFITGVVDSDSLPLNVGRENIQQHSSLKTIKKKLVRKILELLKKLSDEDEEMKQKEEEEAKVEEGKEKPERKYIKFWNEFGKAIRMGIIEDETNRNRLSKLLRFYSSKSLDSYSSLVDYISRMKPDQDHIYYICGQGLEEVKKSPHLEQLLEKDYEVIYFVEPMDEYMMQGLMEFDDKRFMDVSKEDLKLDKDATTKKLMKKLRKKFKPLTDWWQKLFTKNLEKVVVSRRLSTSPCAVVTSKYGWSANMERIMASQALNDPMRANFMKGQKILEINPGHPLIKELNEMVQRDPDNADPKAMAQLLFDAALLESGFEPGDMRQFTTTLHSFIHGAIRLDVPLNQIEMPTFPDDESEDEDTAEEDPEDKPSPFEEQMEKIKLDLEKEQASVVDDEKDEL